MVNAATIGRLAKGQAREELIKATLRCIAEHGIENCTVRRVAQHAGVTNGLIRFYFREKAELIKTAYEYHLDDILKTLEDSIDGFEGTPLERLRRLLKATFTSPVVTGQSVLLWASFVPLAFRIPAMTKVRDSHFRASTQLFKNHVGPAMIAEHGSVDEDRIDNAAMQLSAIADGLWISGSMYPDLLDSDYIEDLGFDAAEKLLGMKLTNPVQFKVKTVGTAAVH